ncbi:MAG: sensor histidine kinase [Nitrosospira sp.]|nr:sensor histidine kinase [Nitrosospira sp.]
MNFRILNVGINSAQDIVTVRQRARQISHLLRFGMQDQVRIATAVSEISRHAFSYASGGRAVFEYDGSSPTGCLVIRINENGGKLRESRQNSPEELTRTHDLESAIKNVGRLMSACVVESGEDHGNSITVRKLLPDSTSFTGAELADISSKLATSPLANSFSEVQQQNQELMETLAELRERQDDLLSLTRELEDTNRGVLALYAEIEEKAKRLQHADQMKSRFLSNTSHELRTPLSSIRALSKLLLERMDGELTYEQEKQVRFIEGAASDLSKLVNGLLDLAKIEAGKIYVDLSPFSVENLFSGLKGMLRPLATNPSVELVFQDPIETLEIYSDENKVIQILRNLVANALKFTELGQVTVSVAVHINTVRFTVSDTGIGIAPENLEFIFEEFSQIENPLQRMYKGTGLGLPLCRKLGQLLKGDVGVSSKPGFGSIFFLDLPRHYAGKRAGAPVDLPIAEMTRDHAGMSTKFNQETG